MQGALNTDNYLQTKANVSSITTLKYGCPY